MWRALREHWPEYLIEAAALGAFMVSAVLFTVALFHPASPALGWIPSPDARRALMAVAMGLTAIAIIYSPWGKQSGAHMNPAVTLTFLRLGKIAPPDAALYVTAQFAGGLGGTLLAARVAGHLVEHPDVRYAVTIPGVAGAPSALLAETLISFLLMFTVLAVSNRKQSARFTGLFAGSLVALFIFFESPVSGMSMNPARTVASAAPAHVWTAVWIYFAAPLAGMMLAAEMYIRRRGIERVLCAKLHHHNDRRCIFHCGWN